MGATMKASILQALEIDAAIIESLSEPVLSELIGFIEYDNQLAGKKDREPEYNGACEVGHCAAASTFPDGSDNNAKW